MSNSIDNMIESFVGSVRQNTEVKDTGALGGFSLQEKPKTDTEAAKVLRAKALLGWEACFPKSRKDPHWTVWGQFVKEFLGLSRIGKPRLEKILTAAGCGISDSSNLVLIIAEEPDVIEEFASDPFKEEESSEEEEEESSEEEVGEEALANPLKSTGPRTLECGHTDWYKEEDHIKAREEHGYCCAGRTFKGAVDWSVRGLMYPVPPSLCKGASRFDNAPSFAWDGYCTCPHTGLYIGGTTNDCRSNPNGNRCAIHKGMSSRANLSIKKIGE